MKSVRAHTVVGGGEHLGTWWSGNEGDLGSMASTGVSCTSVAHDHVEVG